MPDKPVWVAPNALYSRRSIGPAGDSGAVRNDVLYVGRFEPAKKVALLIEGFSIFARKFPDARLVLVGDGSQLDALRTARARMDDPNSVLFAGWIDHVSDLSNWYATAFCTVSPGFAGLGLTQSLGFGIPMVIADDEPHSPEIELAVGERTNWFVRDSPESLAMAIEEFWNSRDSIPRSDFSDVVRETYSAEAMADGLLAALRGSTNMRVGT
jgi:glycosyltransferase involved in cell wall biosynthesis